MTNTAVGAESPYSTIIQYSLAPEFLYSTLIYGLQCFALTKRDLKSLDFAVNRFLMKLFRSNNIEIIAECRRYFHFNLPSELIEKKKTKFEENYSRCVLVYCVTFACVLVKF